LTEQPEAQQCITLNSLVRKTDNTDCLKSGIKLTGAFLSRKGRSRNWYLYANNRQILDIIALIQQSNEASWLWVAKNLGEHKRPLSDYELLELVRMNPSITVNQLMAESDCSLVQARKALDQFEWGA
jgi:Ribosome recycling factor